MFAIKNACSRRGIRGFPMTSLNWTHTAIRRTNSTVLAPVSHHEGAAQGSDDTVETVKDTTQVPKDAQDAPKRRVISLRRLLRYIATAEQLETASVEEFFSKIQGILARESAKSGFDAVQETQANNNNFHTLLNRGLKSHGGQEADAQLGYKLLTVFKQARIANVSHFLRVMDLYLLEGKPEDALSVYVESIEYVGSLVDRKSYVDVKFPDRIDTSLYTAFLYSYFLKQQEPDLAVYQQLSGQTKLQIHPGNLNRYLGFLKLDQQFVTFAHRYFKKHQLASSDPNDVKFFHEGMSAAVNHQISGLERSYNGILEAHRLSKIPIAELTYRNMMHMFAVGLKPQRLHEIWNLMVESLGTPRELATWNELLFSFSKVKGRTDAETKLANVLKLETTFKYIDENFKADLATMSHMVAGFLANGEFQKLFELVQELSGNGRKGVKLELEVISTYLIGLLQAGKAAELQNLLLSFLKSGYKPDIRVVNTFLAHFNKSKSYQACDEMVSLLQKHEITPDVATYTMLIDVILKNSGSNASANGSTAKLDTLLGSIIAEMKSNGISFSNSVTLTLIINGLAKEGSMDSVHLLLEYMKLSKIPIPFMLYTSVIDAECRYGDLGVLKLLFKESIDKGVKPNVPYYNNMISGCLRANSLKDALNYFEKLRADHSLTPNFYTYFYILSYLNGRTLNKDVATAVVQDLGKVVEESGINLGKMLPKVLRSLGEKGVDVSKLGISKLARD